MSRRALVRLALATTVLLAGCGSGGAGTSAPASTAPANTTPGPTSPGPTSPGPTSRTAPLTTTGTATGSRPTDAVHGPGTYLALGDSIAFGYRPVAAHPAPDYHSTSTFVGYPEVLGHDLDLRVVNLACPGETVASMIDTAARSNGCENHDGRGTGFRDLYPLHTSYHGAQLTYAVEYLRAHRVSLVTIGIGLNDIAICRDDTVHRCRSVAERRTFLAATGRALQHVFTVLRTGAHYRGPIVAVTYYATMYADPANPAFVATTALDGVISAVARRNDALVADGYGAFRRASSGHDGSPCAAGLTIPLQRGGCDLHPTLAGQTLLAAAVRTALGG